jgi:hypothetical protein
MEGSVEECLDRTVRMTGMSRTSSEAFKRKAMTGVRLEDAEESSRGESRAPFSLMRGWEVLQLFVRSE